MGRASGQVIAATLVAAAAVIAGCGSNGGGDDRPGPKLAIDERNGLVQGVGLGDRDARVKQVFGQPPRGQLRGFVYPVELDPGEATSPAPGRAPPGRIRTLRYQGVSFISVGGEVIDVIATSERAATHRRLRPGDPISRVEQLYPALRCGQTDVGHEAEVFEPACWGRTGEGAHIWIGGDPINNVRLSTRPLEPLP